MKQLVNKNLITLKCVLFCFLSGIGCIFPFLPLHMLDIGLERSEIHLICAIAPCIALLGPALLGPLIDKLSVGRGSTGAGPSGSGRLLRVVTAICLILSAVFYTLLLTVPYAEKHEARRPNVFFKCGSDGGYVVQEVCTEGMSCKRWEGAKSGVLAVEACEYICANDNFTWVDVPFEDSTASSLMSEDNSSIVDEDDMDYEINPPHLCNNGKCQVYMQHVGRMRLPLSLLSPEPLDDDADQKLCVYRTVPEGKSKCTVPSDRLAQLLEYDKECEPAVRCRVLDPYDEPDGVLADAECRLVIGDPSYTFWSYFVLRVLADIWPTAALALLGAACVIATRETSLGRGDVGRQLAIGTLGLAIFPPLAGLASQEMPENKYLVPFVMHAVLMLIGALILLVDKNMPLSTPEWWWHTATGVLTMPMNAVRRYGAETAAVFAVVALLGVMWGGIDTYLPWMASNVANATKVELGLTMTAGALPALPALWCAEALVDYVGHSNVFITAFVFYCLRYTALAYTTDYSWIVASELLEVFTLSLVWVTAILYFRHLVPRKYTVTGQALPVIAHFCLGRCIVAIIMATLQTPLEATQDMYCGLGVVAILSAAIYLALYHLLLAPRCAAPAQALPNHLLQGFNGNNGTNGSYSPIRVYHEERSRKGHFRY